MNYSQKFTEIADALIERSIEDRAERIAEVGRLVEGFSAKYGKHPPANVLERLTDYILREELLDTSRSKTFNAEYPFLSERQLERRYDREYSIELADNYDINGINRAKPERRHRIAKEERFIDKASRAKNRARNAQYKQDTSSGLLAAYNLKETGGEFAPEFIESRSASACWLEFISR